MAAGRSSICGMAGGQLKARSRDDKECAGWAQGDVDGSRRSPNLDGHERLHGLVYFGGRSPVRVEDGRGAVSFRSQFDALDPSSLWTWQRRGGTISLF